ncbi:MAG: hypothetical protein V2I76_01180, partial [Roseobacter sp.]|nr:hypothetical protein [Roseobacter sp.]
MAANFSDMQASLLYEVEPAIQFHALFEAFCARATDLGLSGSFQILKDASDDRTLALSGTGLHALITLRTTPCDISDFEVALRAPILKFKPFDSKAAIAAHSAALVISVGDGEKPRPFHQREALRSAGVKPAELTHKLALLHVLMNCLVDHSPPTVINFSPTQLLLSPDEFQAVADTLLPLPILFHPYPIIDGKDANGMLRMGMVAIHAQHLIGAELALENAPQAVDVGSQISLLAKLIAQKRSGNLSLNDGELVEPAGKLVLRVRHAQSDAPDASHRIIARFEDGVPDKPNARGPQGQQAFQDRIARLKTRS